MKHAWLIALAVLLALPCSTEAQQVKDSDRLGMALEYFKSGKYHEALLIFERLDKDYKLNPRFHAYMGLCYYREWDYERAITEFDRSLPALTGLSPHERSVYYYARAESHFALGNYSKAMPDYEHVLTLCYDRERADCHYRIGFCLMQQGEWANAAESLESALAYYERFLNDDDPQPRIRQIKHMIAGCKAHEKNK